VVEDRELVAALRSAVDGDPAGFAVLWRALQPPLLRYLRVVVGRAAADDVASETWLQTVRDLHTFTGDATAFRVWLFRVARNRALDLQRREGRRREEPVGDAPADERASAPDPAAVAAERADLAWALDLIAALPHDQAEAVMLRVVAGLDVAQTAQVLGKRAGAVRIAAMRGLRRLATDEEVLRRQRARTGPEPERPPVIDTSVLDAAVIDPESA
jgi:RNA polymerase sigma-70 factor, ECF subfamily